MRHMSAERSQQLRELLEEGRSNGEIAALMGISRVSVSKRARIIGASRSPEAIKKLRVLGNLTNTSQEKSKAATMERISLNENELRRMCALGLSLREMGERLEVRAPTVRSWCRKLGLTKAAAPARRGKRDRSEFIKLWRLGVRIDEIMVKMGFTKGSVVNLARRLGLPSRMEEPPEELLRGGEQLHGPSIDS